MAWHIIGSLPRWKPLYICFPKSQFKGPLSLFVVTLGNWAQVTEKRLEILQYKLRLRKQ